MTKCNVVLLNPPTAAPSSEILLNLAYLSSTLKNAGHNVLILDATAPYKKLNEEETKRRILEFEPHFIGVTLTIVYIPHTYEYLKHLKKLKIPIIAGGPHANCLPEEVLKHGTDIVAIGEGEDTILELAEYFLGEKKLKDIPGICFKDKKGKPHYTQARPLIENLDRIPFPDYDSFPIKNYTGNSDPDSNPIFWSMFSSRGCPYNCIFCSSHNVFGRTYRRRSPDNVFEEIKHMHKTYGAKMFAFQDDEAFIDKKRVIKFCGQVKKKLPPLKFSGRLRIDSLNAEMIKAMKSVGFTRLAFGIESFNNETLGKINKKYDIDEIAKGFKILEKADFKTVYFNNLVGFPWETSKHLAMSLKEISKIPPSIKWFTSTNTLIPYPGTKLYDDYHKEYDFTDWWLDKKMNSPRSKTDVEDAFFMLFMFDQIPLWLDDAYWNHPKKMKKAIEKFCWGVASLSLQRCLSSKELGFVMRYSKISHKLWRKSPALEKIFMYPFTRIAKNRNLHEKVRFINQ